jgi:hypothetical protein
MIRSSFSVCRAEVDVANEHAVARQDASLRREQGALLAKYEYANTRDTTETETERDARASIWVVGHKSFATRNFRSTMWAK